MPAHLACAEGISFKADSMAVLPCKKVASGGDRMRIICHIGQVQRRWFFLSSLLLRLLSEFSSYSEPPFQVTATAAGCIQDYVETSVMLHYNHRRDNNADVFELTTYNY